MFAPHSLPLAFLPNLMGQDGLVILILAFLIFGRRLPEIGKNLGKTIVEFKKGLNGGYSDEDKSPPAEPAQPASRRLQSGSRVSVNDNLDERPRPVARVSKSLPQNEEV